MLQRCCTRVNDFLKQAKETNQGTELVVALPRSLYKKNFQNKTQLENLCVFKRHERFLKSHNNPSPTSNELSVHSNTHSYGHSRLHSLRHCSNHNQGKPSSATTSPTWSGSLIAVTTASPALPFVGEIKFWLTLIFTTYNKDEARRYIIIDEINKVSWVLEVWWF